MDYETSEKIKELEEIIENCLLAKDAEGYVKANLEITSLYHADDDYLKCDFYLLKALNHLENSAHYYQELTAIILGGLVGTKLKIDHYFKANEYFLQLISLSEILEYNVPNFELLDFAMEFGIGKFSLARKKLKLIISNPTKSVNPLQNLEFLLLMSELGIMEMERMEYKDANIYISGSYEFFLKLKSETFTENPNIEEIGIHIADGFNINEVKLLLNLGKFYMKVGNLKLAESNFAKASETITRDKINDGFLQAELALNLCIADYELGNAEEARKSFENGNSKFNKAESKDNTKWSEFYFLRSEYEMLSGNLESALTEITKAIELIERKTVLSHFSLINMYQLQSSIELQLKKYNDASNSLSHAYKNALFNFDNDSPKLYLIRFNYGKLLFTTNFQKRQEGHDMMNESINDAKKNLRPNHEMINHLESMLS